jgi:hypothetical protein
MDAVQQRADEAGDQVVLRLEMVIQTALRDAKALGDLPE